MEYLNIGYIIGSFKLDGSVKAISTSYFSDDRYKEGNKLRLVKGDIVKEVTVEKSSINCELVMVKFEEINDCDEAQSYKGFDIEIDAKYAKIPENCYRFTDLVGCAILDQNGNNLGNVIKVEEFPAQLTLRCQTKEKKNFFVPFIKQFIIDVSIDKKEIKINLIDGIL